VTSQNAQGHTQKGLAAERKREKNVAGFDFNCAPYAKVSGSAQIEGLKVVVGHGDVAAGHNHPESGR
jgi:hypothetical protein